MYRLINSTRHSALKRRKRVSVESLPDGSIFFVPMFMTNGCFAYVKINNDCYPCNGSLRPVSTANRNFWAGDVIPVGYLIYGKLPDNGLIVRVEE